MKKGLSLVEVLVATMIIAVAVYGMILALGAQQLAEGRARDSKVLRQLHYQLVREILKGQRDYDGNANMVLTQNIPLNPGDPKLVCPQMAGTAQYAAVLNGGTYTSTLQLFDDTNPAGGVKPRGSSIIQFFYSYNWKNVQP